MKGRERAELRAEAHHLEPLVHVGEHVTPAVERTIDDALRTHEMVKIAIGKKSETEPKVLAGQLASALSARVIQVIGRKVTLYRHNHELWEKPRLRAPWAK